MTQTPFVGPPPTPPREPVHHEPMHLVHLILSVLTAGFWLVIWLLAAMNASGANAQERQRFEREQREYEQRYDEWQRQYHRTYGR